MKVKHAILFSLIILAAGCKTSHITLAYKSPNRPRQEYARIVVTSIIKSENVSLKKKIEKWFADDMKELGYNAVPAIEALGPGGLSGMNDAETYRELCNKGIDAIITVALIDNSKETKSRSYKLYGYPNNYYYERIKHYDNILVDLADETILTKERYSWESIFFDLVTLEARCTIQSRPFKEIEEKKVNRDFEKQIIRKMIKEKILTKNPKKAALKPF